ncbi:LiaF transmembrane domain-containing protein [Mariniphaga sediminis]|nr:LiaF domain-containing protein [Mariniphaga sediminis]
MKSKNICHRRSSFGIFLIAVGVLWILVKLHLIPDVWADALISWQMLLIGIGVFSFIAGNRLAGTILIIIGSFFLVDHVWLIPHQLRRIGWPLVIIGVGMALLLTRHRKRPSPTIELEKHGTDYFDDFVVFGGKEVFINSKKFLGGKITTIFAGAEYDLRQASLSENGAVIDCVSIFGGSGFKVPPDWNIKNEITTVFGAFTDKRGMSAHEISYDPSKTLIIKGFSAFGGVEVKFN